MRRKSNFAWYLTSFIKARWPLPSISLCFIYFYNLDYSYPIFFYPANGNIQPGNHDHVAAILYPPLRWPLCCCVIMSVVMWFGCVPSCQWSSAPQNSDDDIWLFVQWGPLKPVNSAPQSLSILLLFNSTSERLLACWTGGRRCNLKYSGGQVAQYLFFGNVGNQRGFFTAIVFDFF